MLVLLFLAGGCEGAVPLSSAGAGAAAGAADWALGGVGTGGWPAATAGTAAGVAGDGAVPGAGRLLRWRLGWGVGVGVCCWEPGPEGGCWGWGTFIDG